jgi:uncharacterized coiled-coil protein SlyX
METKSIDDQLNEVIAALEQTIAVQEKQLSEISFKLKVDKAKLKQMKKINETQG